MCISEVCTIIFRGDDLSALGTFPPASKMRRDIGSHVPRQTRGETLPDAGHADINVDWLIIGAGFGGVYLLHALRKLGYSCKILEAGKDLGGIWHWKSYPGAGGLTSTCL